MHLLITSIARKIRASGRGDPPRSIDESDKPCRVARTWGDPSQALDRELCGRRAQFRKGWLGEVDPAHRLMALKRHQGSVPEKHCDWERNEHDRPKKFR